MIFCLQEHKDNWYSCPHHVHWILCFTLYLPICYARVTCEVKCSRNVCGGDDGYSSNHGMWLTCKYNGVENDILSTSAAVFLCCVRDNITDKIPRAIVRVGGRGQCKDDYVRRL